MASTIPPLQKKVVHWDSVVKLLLSFCTLIGFIWAGFSVILGQVASVTTDQELLEHNMAREAHPKLRDVDTAHAAIEAELRKLIDDEHRTSVSIGEKLVSVTAAYAEPQARLRAAVAKRHVRVYKSLIQRGVPVWQAIDEALEESWPDDTRGW